MALLRCPICDRRFDTETTPAMPFCSERCRLVDLGHWLDESRGLPYESEDAPFDPDELPED
jgi:hypothetical protein